MTRSRVVVLASAVVVGLGMVAGMGALYLDPARAAVGPLPPQALSFPADTRFVMGIDVKRFVASPFYQRYANRGSAQRLDSFRDLEEKTGLNPERDVDYIYLAGGQLRAPAGPHGGDGLAIVLGRFDRYKLSRAIETEKKATTKNVQGTAVYLFNENAAGRAAGAMAFLDDDALVLGSQAAVEQVIGARLRGEPTLRQNTALLTLIESVHPGSTFWMAGDQTLLQSMPRSIPGAGGPGGRQSLELPVLKSLVVTGDLEPDVALDLLGEAADEPGAKSLADLVRGFVALASLQANQKPEVKQLASAVSVTTEANRVRVTARFPYELLDALQPKPRAAVEDPAEPGGGVR